MFPDTWHHLVIEVTVITVLIYQRFLNRNRLALTSYYMLFKFQIQAFYRSWGHEENCQTTQLAQTDDEHVS